MRLLFRLWIYFFCIKATSLLELRGIFYPNIERISLIKIVVISFIEIRGTSLKKLNEGKFMNKMKGGHLKSFVSHGTDK